jgi:hypothetical protein
VKSTEFAHEYDVFGGFWLPVRHRSKAQLRLFGASTLEIEYGGYHWSEREGGPAEHARIGLGGQLKTAANPVGDSPASNRHQTE